MDRGWSLEGRRRVNEQLLESDPFREHFCGRFSKYD